jgi:hypothetical protein
MGISQEELEEVVLQMRITQAQDSAAALAAAVKRHHEARPLRRAAMAVDPHAEGSVPAECHRLALLGDLLAGFQSSEP